jgi:hypothetical protein
MGVVNTHPAVSRCVGVPSRRNRGTHQKCFPILYALGDGSRPPLDPFNILGEWDTEWGNHFSGGGVE